MARTGPLPCGNRTAASSQSAELAIIGVPASNVAGRRVNAGVVNIGAIPATFRFSVRTRTGQPIGGEWHTLAE